jgi:hypothetical protein
MAKTRVCSRETEVKTARRVRDRRKGQCDWCGRRCGAMGGFVSGEIGSARDEIAGVVGADGGANGEDSIETRDRKGGEASPGIPHRYRPAGSAPARPGALPARATCCARTRDGSRRPGTMRPGRETFAVAGNAPPAPGTLPARRQRLRRCGNDAPGGGSMREFRRRFPIFVSANHTHFFAGHARAQRF